MVELVSKTYEVVVVPAYESTLLNEYSITPLITINPELFDDWLVLISLISRGQFSVNGDIFWILLLHALQLLVSPVKVLLMLLKYAVLNPDDVKLFM